MIDNFSLESPAKVSLALESAEHYLQQADVFFGHGTDNAWDESVAILFWLLELDEDPGREILDVLLTEKQTQKFVDTVTARARDKIPVPYLTGEAWFCGFKFSVSRDVLVPRSPIAEMIRNEYRPWVKSPPINILDLCSGSGCIGIAAALYNEKSNVVLSELSDEACSIAALNIGRYDLAERVQLIQGDLFENLNQRVFDLILTNPPYVDANDIAAMPEEYRHEPMLGLASGRDGLDLTRRILSEAKKYLTDDGILVLEVGNSWSNLEAAFPAFPFTWVEFADGGEGVCVITAAELASHCFG